MNVITVYAVSIWDGSDGRTNKSIYFEHEADAKKWVENNKFDSYHVHSTNVFTSLQDYADFKSGEIRRKALLKLTPEEKAVLGLS